ncbi:MAG: hypothetical protein CL543_13640 [Alcanivorax sp.]|nr:hypothetical protein [Alcanivorax sp.]MCQ6261234.1 hypothetical protein [Alcanivorax sp. MM125-6]UWN51205.1 hypothetical protein ASALC70_03430 [Alcanivorax sp. ALC70]
MGEIVPFKKPPRKKPQKGLCQHGFHKWKVVKNTRFDSQKGKLVTRYQCERCGKRKVEAH